MPLFRKPSSSTGATPADHVAQKPVDPARPQGKGHPTPKRRDAQAANRRPLVQDSKNLSGDQKARQREERARAREAMMRGEEKYLPERDRGPERRFLRDAVDRRRTVGEILLPAMLLVLLISLLPVKGFQLVFFFLAYGLILASIVDCWILWRSTKKAFVAAFGHEPPQGSAWYVVLRALQMRTSRVPRPAVARGAELRRR